MRRNLEESHELQTRDIFTIDDQRMIRTDSSSYYFSPFVFVLYCLNRGCARMNGLHGTFACWQTG